MSHHDYRDSSVILLNNYVVMGVEGKQAVDTVGQFFS